MTTVGIGIIAILVIIVLGLYGIGRLSRNKPRPLQIIVITAAMLITFLCLALGVNRFGIDVYEGYQYDTTCPNAVVKCIATTQQDFDASIPRLTLLMTLPQPLRPACETISAAFCTLEKTWDFASISYILGAFGTLIALFIVLLGLRQKRAKAVQLDNPLPT